MSHRPPNKNRRKLLPPDYGAAVSGELHKN
jgi:hypothetical protein